MDEIKAAVNSVRPNIRERFLIYMRREKITKTELAKHLGCTQQWIGRVLSGKQKNLPPDYLNRFYDAIAQIKEERGRKP